MNSIYSKAKSVAIFAFIFHSTSLKAQVANFINNGSFEEYYYCTSPYTLSDTKFWLSIDSVSFGGVYLSTCNGLIPLSPNTYQYPKTGNAFVGTTVFYPTNIRGYPKNRLKRNLSAGKTYCVKFYLNITNQSPRGIDGFGIYFGDYTIDTITNCTIPLSYLNPQVKNTLGNVITDTLNWVPITGTFVANGTEKYALIGNFLADNAVSTTSINSPSFPENWTDALFDDVSCVEVNLPAYAGPDRSFIAGDSIFIGRQPDFAIDPGCVWYQLPNATPIATISGLWVKPVTTTTYVVRQELECSPLKWDTVVVYQTAVGLAESKILNEKLRIYPVPADEILELKILNEKLFQDFNHLIICNSLGQMVREEEINFKTKTLIISIVDLVPGVYQIKINSSRSVSVSKRFLISR